MAHGAKDYGNLIHGKVTHGLYDMAELAIRLGAISSIDRLGDVIFSDDFSNGKEAWYTTSNGAGGEVAISSQYFKYGGFSLKLKAGSDVFKYAHAKAYLSYPEPSKIGFEVNFSFNSDVSYITFVFDVPDGTNYHSASIKQDLVDNKFQYWGIDSARHDIGSFLDPTDLLWHFNSLKFVVDVITGYYVRLIYNGISYDLSNYKFEIYTSTDPPTIQPYIFIYSKTGVNGIAYIDNVIITRNEP